MAFIYNPLLIFLFGYIFLRITGKKAVSQMHSFDMLYILIIGNVISQPMQKDNVWQALLFTFIVMLLYKLFMWLSLNNKLRWTLFESPTVLIRNGDIDRTGLRKVRLPMDELLAQLRVKGFTDTRNIALCAMEDNGQISVIPKSNFRPVQPGDLKIKVKREFIPIPVIMDGQIIDHNLKYLKLDREWLLKRVKQKGADVQNVLLATITESGTLHIDTNNPHNEDKGPYSYKPGEDN
ncbi:Uncharacterized membrane protein YcaP, DUF421 family [Fictibacillus enclensis]|uniref:YetF C-terminal domain-containing protein n=1 Tax=Fictibacillus enclensis TaxID=1017270 RepID=A0A0V8JAV9_9BACL|nr:DUF421 domain-containing protein [Fictibacillus enclensis]KSU84042.1 hypothetical protein AS030_00250 [Fictibacillus enclensis]SCB72221.1 Uncharacterized membrane protein YcaP, DUF421 family [Fictibacillus enclensis]